MARFNGVKQGIGVWLWAIVIAVVAVILGVVAGRQFDLTGQAIGLPQFPFDPPTMTTRGIVTVLAVLVTSLLERSSAVWRGCGSTAGSTVAPTSPRTEPRRPLRLRSPEPPAPGSEYSPLVTEHRLQGCSVGLTGVESSFRAEPETAGRPAQAWG